jgi:RNA polymerase sigma factor (sigma-70 family)
MPHTVQQLDPSVPTDCDLLRRFVQNADEDAFAEIVQRHHELVMGVCRRVVGNDADVDDAFQATFITLARRPRQIRSKVSLSSWLYTVAWRTSLRLIRQRKEYPVNSLNDQLVARHTNPLEKIASAQECLILDEELNDLPARYRDVLVMAYFSQQSSQEIADQLNVSTGTIDGRMRQARNMLRVKLVRRGVELAVIAVAANQCTGASAAVVAPELLSPTILLGTQTLNGCVPAATDLSHLNSLIRPETITMPTKSLLTAVICFAVIAGVAGIVGAAALDESTAVLNTDGGNVDSETPLSTVDQTKTVTIAGAEIQQAPATPAANTVRPVTNGRFTIHAGNDPPVEQWLRRMLAEPVPSLNFRDKTPLSEVLETIGTHFTNEHGLQQGLRMTFWEDTAELELEGLSSLDDIFVSNIEVEGVTLRNALNMIFEQTVEPELSYTIQNEVVLVSSLGKLHSDVNLYTRAYRIGNLKSLEVQPRHDIVAPGHLNRSFGRSQQELIPITDATIPQPAPNLVTVLVEMTEPRCRWVHRSGDGGSIRLVGSTLIVQQTSNGHAAIVGLLNLISTAEATE